MSCINVSNCSSSRATENLRQWGITGPITITNKSLEQLCFRHGDVLLWSIHSLFGGSSRSSALMADRTSNQPSSSSCHLSVFLCFSMSICDAAAMCCYDLSILFLTQWGEKGGWPDLVNNMVILSVTNNAVEVRRCCHSFYHQNLLSP